MGDPPEFLLEAAFGKAFITPHAGTNYTFVSPAPCDITLYGKDAKTFVTIDPDGKITLGEGMSNDDGARCFWKAVAELSPTLRRTVESIEAASVAHEAADILHGTFDKGREETRSEVARARRLLETVATPRKTRA